MKSDESRGQKDRVAKPINSPAIFYNDFQTDKSFGLGKKPLPLLYQLLCDQLLRNSNYDNFIRFGAAVNHAIGDIRLTHDQQISALKELEAAGVIKKVDFKGWKIMIREGRNHV